MVKLGKTSEQLLRKTKAKDTENVSQLGDLVIGIHHLCRDRTKFCGKICHKWLLGCLPSGRSFWDAYNNMAADSAAAEYICHLPNHVHSEVLGDTSLAVI